MNAEAERLLGQLLRILHYPLVELGGSQLTLVSLVKFACLLTLVFVAELALRRFFVLRLLRRTHLEPSLQFAVGRMTGYLFIAVGGYVALKLIGIDLSSLAVVAGAIGVGLGFGLQNIISNFISGLILLAERPITIGDRIEVDDVAGQVTQINLRSTTVVTNDNIAIIVPNSNFITNKVVNWSHDDPRVRIRLPVGVAYGTDLDRLQRALLGVAAAHPKVLRDPEPTVFFIGFGDSSLDFELAVWTSEMVATPRRFRSELYFAIERALRENRIEIPFPQRDLHVRSGSLAAEPQPAPRMSGLPAVP